MRRVTRGLADRYVPRDVTGTALRPDLLTSEEPTYGTAHEAADALAAWAARIRLGSAVTAGSRLTP